MSTPKNCNTLLYMVIGAVHEDLRSDTGACWMMGLKYDLDLLRDIGHSAKLEENYHMFSLRYELRMMIIDLDIRKKARLYRRSRAGKRLHHKIGTLFMKLRLHRPRNRSLVQEIMSSYHLLWIDFTRKQLIIDVPLLTVIWLWIKHLTLRWNLWNITWMYVLSLKLGSERVMIPPQSNCVQMATPLCPYLEKEELEEVLQLCTGQI